MELLKRLHTYFRKKISVNGTVDHGEGCGPAKEFLDTIQRFLDRVVLPKHFIIGPGEGEARNPRSQKKQQQDIKAKYPPTPWLKLFRKQFKVPVEFVKKYRHQVFFLGLMNVHLMEIIFLIIDRTFIIKILIILHSSALCKITILQILFFIFFKKK